jgi:hypothetical protein
MPLLSRWRSRRDPRIAGDGFDTEIEEFNVQFNHHGSVIATGTAKALST